MSRDYPHRFDLDDDTPEPRTVEVHQRGSVWAVFICYPNGRTTRVGTHTARYLAEQQAARLRGGS